MKRLADIATVTTGVYQKVNPTGDTCYLQGKHFDEEGMLRQDAVLSQELMLDEKLQRHLLQDGDILLMAKGENNRACRYTREMGQAVASSTFFVIRIKGKQILPAFLQWYLNTAQMQQRLSELTRGTQIASLSKKALIELEISIPSLPAQEKMLVAHQLWQQEKRLTLELIQEKERLYESFLFHQTNRKLV